MDIQTNHFQLTPEGCNAARAYLVLVGKLDRFEKSAFSCDGFSLVATANEEFRKRRKAD